MAADQTTQAPGFSGRGGIFNRILKQTDLLVAVGIVMIVIMMIIPLPPMFLNLLITLNIAAALSIVLVTIYAKEALDFSVFPSLLLITTLFRLAINISVTRLILLHGDAGSIVEAFGSFVVQGNIIVGLVVFIILAVVQFVVITNGAGRVAEVAARFTLDAMPGKQMAIDADLNAGQITDEEARDRRVSIQKEADFYGAMDGAAKFVKGDAIAAVIITLINLIGGIAIGVGQMGLGFGEAVQRFSLLTIGDGLTAQIPALLISTATGIIVTRAASEGNLGDDLTMQLTRHPKALAIVSGVLILLAMVPGLPMFPFIFMGILIGGIAFILNRQLQEELAEKEAAAALASQEETTDASTVENVRNMLPLDVIELEIGYGLIHLVDEDQGGDLLKRVSMIRRQIALDMGVVLQPIRIRDNVRLKATEYAFKLKGNEIVRHELLAGHLLAMNPGDAGAGLDGQPTKEPAFGLDALWIPQAARDRAEALGYTVVDPASIIVTHLTETIREYAAEILSRQDTKQLLDTLKDRYPATVEELIPDVMTVGEVQRVLQALLAEGVSIRDLVSVVETLGDKAKVTKDIGMLAEYCRQALARSITKTHKDLDGSLSVMTLDPALESELADAIVHTNDGSYMNLDPSRAHEFLTALQEHAERVSNTGVQPVILCSAKVRRHVKQMSDQVLPKLPVFSYNEIQPGLEIRTVGMVAA